MHFVQISYHSQLGLLAFVLVHFVYLAAHSSQGMAEVASVEEARNYLKVEDFLAPSCNKNRNVLFGFSAFRSSDLCYSFAFDEVRQWTRHFIHIDNRPRLFLILDQRHQNLSIHPSDFLVLLLVFLHRRRLEVLVRVAHLSEMPGDDGAGKTALELTKDVFGEFNSCVERTFGEGTLDDVLDLHGFAVFPLLLKGSDECAAFDLLCGPELSELVEDSRVAELQFLTDLLQVELRIFTFLFLLGIFSENSVHFCQLFLGDGGPHFPVLLDLVHRARRASFWLWTYGLLFACCGYNPLWLQLIAQKIFVFGSED